MMAPRTGRKRRTANPKAADDKLSLHGLDFEAAIQAALATGTMPATKRAKLKRKAKK